MSSKSSGNKSILSVFFLVFLSLVFTPSFVIYAPVYKNVSLMEIAVEKMFCYEDPYQDLFYWRKHYGLVINS